MSSADPLRKRMARAAAEKDPALRGVRIAAVVARALGEAGIEPTLVGGAAVAFYTEGRHTTRDVDLVAPSGPTVDEAMRRLGLRRRGKDYLSEDRTVYVELPSAALGPTERTDVIEIDGVALRIISIEDLIVDRLCAFKFWKSGIDGLNALILLELGTADRARVESRAGEEDVLDALDHVEDVLERAVRTNLSPDEASDLLNRFLERR
jgi:predicted nucleotidyltransferase